MQKLSIYYQDNVIKHLDIDWYADFYDNEPQETFYPNVIDFFNEDNKKENKRFDGIK